MSLRTRKSCAACAIPCKGGFVLELPATPPANEFLKKPVEQECFPLRLQLCGSCGHLQLADVVDPKRLFENYVYVSGTSQVFVDHFASYAKDVAGRTGLSKESLIVDIGSNDGTLLKQFRTMGHGRLLGIEPAGSIAYQAKQESIPTLVGFFSRRMAMEIRDTEGAAGLVTANNVFAHAEDLEEIALGVKDLLAPDGVFVFEVSYLRDVVEKTLFDTIYHEHLSYHTVGPLLNLLARSGLQLFHAERVGSHGGSLRVYAGRMMEFPSKEADSLINEEQEMGLFHPEIYEGLGKKIAAQGAKLRERIKGWKAAGKRIAGYGAPAKLTTLMYAFGLEGKDFEFIMDDSPWKEGLYTPGMHIPVRRSFTMYESRKELTLNEEKIDVCVVFAWNFFDSIMHKNAAWRGLFVNPLTC